MRMPVVDQERSDVIDAVHRRRKAISFLENSKLLDQVVADEREQAESTRRELLAASTEQMRAARQALIALAPQLQKARVALEAAEFAVPKLREAHGTLATRAAGMQGLIEGGGVFDGRSINTQLRLLADPRIGQLRGWLGVLAESARWAWQIWPISKATVGGVERGYGGNAADCVAARAALLSLQDQAAALQLQDYGNDPEPQLRELENAARKTIAPLQISEMPRLKMDLLAA